MRVRAPGLTVKDVWDALLTGYGVVGSYAKLIEDQLDAPVSGAKADLSTLETRLSAARAGFLDNLDAAISSIPGLRQSGIPSGFENYTLTMNRTPDNDATFVTVLDITGRGILVSVGYAAPEGAQKGADLRITVDGGGAITEADFFGVTGITIEEMECGVTFMLGFASSLLVEMALAGVDTPAHSFKAVALVE